MRDNELINLVAKKLYDKCIRCLTEDEENKFVKFLINANFCGVCGFYSNGYICWKIFFNALRFYNFNIDFLIKNAIYSETYMYERWKEIDIQQILYKIKPITDFFYEKTSIEKDTKLSSIWKDVYKEDMPSNMLNKNNFINIAKYTSYRNWKNTTIDGDLKNRDFMIAIRNVIFSNPFDVYRQSRYRYLKNKNDYYYARNRNNKQNFFYRLKYFVYNIRDAYNVNTNVEFYIFFLNNYTKTYRCFDTKLLQKFYKENENWFN